MDPCSNTQGQFIKLCGAWTWSKIDDIFNTRLVCRRTYDVWLVRNIPHHHKSVTLDTSPSKYKICKCIHVMNSPTHVKWLLISTISEGGKSHPQIYIFSIVEIVILHNLLASGTILIRVDELLGHCTDCLIIHYVIIWWI